MMIYLFVFFMKKSDFHHGKQTQNSLCFS